MSRNSENSLARLLFAILKQKDLRDVNWDLVANDPVLLKPITNGHAARMRYSRFRGSVLEEAQKKPGANTGSKNRVSKPKKSGQTKREGFVKGEYEPAMASYPQFSPASTTSPYLGDTSDEFGDRFPTPFSDDMVVHPGNTLHTDVTGSLFPNVDGANDFLNPAASDFEAALDDMYKAGGHADLHSQNPLDLNDTQSLADCGGDWTSRFHHDQHHF